MNEKTRIVRSDRALSSPIDEELVLFDSEAGKYYGFNEMATEIWKRLDTPKTIETICRELLEEFGVEPDECRRDVPE